VTIGEQILVCHLVSDDAWGGAEVVVAGLLRTQAKRSDLRLHLIALNAGRLSRLAVELGIPVEVAPESGRSFVALLRDVSGRIARLRPQIVHSHRYKENLLSYLSARRFGARSVVTLHGEEAPARLATRLALALRYAMMHRLARGVGARFAAVSEDLRARFSMLADRCEVIPNGVQILPEQTRVPSPPRTQQVIGWVGRLVPIKSLPTLFEALARLPASLAGTRLLLVGDGPERPALVALAARLGLADRIEFAGFVEDPSATLSRMDVFALPSLHEGLPVALLEAMAASLPCVAAAVGGIPEVEGGSGALKLVASREPQDWAAALAELLENPAQRAALGARGRARIAEHFSIDAMVDRYVELYRAALAGTAP
jgi:glycosyltransferase involved in cell wall biosynthesis